MNFFIYPEKDTTIYKQKKLRLLNSGIDEVIELTNLFDEANGHDVSRILLKFNLDNITKQDFNLKSAKYILNLKIMSSSELEEHDIISAYPLKKSWVEGVGRFIPSSDAKEYSKGANWKYTDGEEEMWVSGSHYDSSGGGDWYDSAICVDADGEPTKINCLYQFQKNFSDVKIDITKIINFYLEGSIPNHGIIIKFENESTSGSGNVKFYSSDTNTIYSPFIQIKYTDFIFDPCKQVTFKKLICTKEPTPTPTPTFSSGTICSGTMNSGTLCSGTLHSGTLDSGSLESGSYDPDIVVETDEFVDNTIFSEDSLKKEELGYDMENLIFTDCQLDDNISNSSIDYETEPITHPNTLKQVYGSDLIPTIKRLKKEYRSFSRERISVGLREKYPQKSFSSKSDYSSNNFTTDTLKYSVRDAETEETLIEFDEYSKISCDSEGHFFNFDFSCLATGRVYKFLILLESEYGDFLHEDKRRFIVRV